MARSGLAETDQAAMEIGDTARDRKTEPRTRLRVATGDLVEALKDTTTFLLGNTRPFILNRDCPRRRVQHHAHRYATAFGTICNRVIDKVGDDFP